VAALGIIAAVLFLFGAAALICALFFWLERLVGPPGAALIVATVASALGLFATLPPMFGRRPEPPPPPGATLPPIAALAAQSATSLGPRQTALAAFLPSIALGLMARGSSSNKK
jgi:hypothetical protein